MCQLPVGRQHSRDPGLSSIGEVCGPMRLILSSLRFATIMTIYSIESFREFLSTRSKRAMTALR
jgi:hypothetical protein